MRPYTLSLTVTRITIFFRLVCHRNVSGKELYDVVPFRNRRVRGESRFAAISTRLQKFNFMIKRVLFHVSLQGEWHSRNLVGSLDNLIIHYFRCPELIQINAQVAILPLPSKYIVPTSSTKIAVSGNIAQTCLKNFVP